MFQRQSRPAFPGRNIALLAAAVLLMLLFIISKLRENKKQELHENEAETETSESATPGQFPYETFFAMRDYPVFHPSMRKYNEAISDARDRYEAARPRGGNDGVFAPWTLEGPGNIGARINAVAVDPQNHNIIYIGYSHGGVWRTTNGGQSWNPMFDDNNYLSIGSIAIDPANPTHVYVGTGDPNISIFPFIGDGIWKSTDRGINWAPIGLQDQRIVSRIFVNSAVSNKIYAATMGLPFERNSDRGLYIKDMASSAWNQKLFIADGAGVIDMVVSNTNPNVIFAAGWDRVRNNHESVASGNNARIWKTKDGGNSWQMLSGGLPQTEMCRIGLTIDPNNDLHVLASYAGTDLSFEGLYETFDGGLNWQKNAGNGLNNNFQSNFAWYFGQVRINPFNSQDIWLLGVSSFRSTDGGQNWFRAVGNQQGVHADHHDLAFISATEFLMATDGGLYRSSDNGGVWTRIENIPTTQFYRVAYNPHQPTLYYGGAQDNGTSAGNASMMNNWQRVYGADGFQAVFHPNNPDIYYYEYQFGSINGTIDGIEFFDATDGIDGADRRNWDMPYILSHHDPDVMYAGTYRLYEGNGHLPVWFPLTGDLTDGDIFGASFHSITTIDESPLDPDQVYVGTSDGNVWRINPAGQSSTNISAGLPDRYVSSVKASPGNPDRVFVSHTGYKDNDFSPRLHRSDDRGNTWAPIVGDLPDLAINEIQILPGHQDSIIFAATDGGVYITLNSGINWERLGTGMPFVPVFDLDLNLSQKTLIAGTFARSMYSFPIDSLHLAENSSTFSPGGLAPPNLAVSPSPAYSSTMLSVENLKSNQVAEVVITDASGRSLWRGQFKGFGKHEENIDLNQFVPGVYIAFARTNGKVWGTRKFIVTR